MRTSYNVVLKATLKSAANYLHKEQKLTMLIEKVYDIYDYIRQQWINVSYP